MNDAKINPVATEINSNTGVTIPNLPDIQQTNNLQRRDRPEAAQGLEKRQETSQGEKKADKETERERRMEGRVKRLEEKQRGLERCLCVVTTFLLVVIAVLLGTGHNQDYNTYKSTSSDFPPKLYAIDKGQKVAVAGERATALLHVLDEGHDCTLGTKMLKCTCRLVPLEPNSEQVNCSVKNKEQSQNDYEIAYKPTSPGKYQLHITVEGEHIQESPANVTVIKKYEFPIKYITGLSGPQGIAFNMDEMIVAEYLGHNYIIISPSGENASVGSNGKKKGQFEHPTGVAVDSKGYILVVDHKNHRIQKFNPLNEAPPKTVGKTQEINSPELTLPVGIGIHPHTKMIYVTTENKNQSIQILHPDLTYYKGFGSVGSDDGQFNQPKDVAFDSAGNVYVADNENHRIQVFSAEGKYLRKFEDRSNLDYPTGISIDSNDVVYVSMLYKHCVVIFTSDGQYVTKFGTEGKEPGQFKDPRGIEVKDGQIYVSDYGNSRIQIF